MEAAQALTENALDKFFAKVHGGTFEIVYKDGATQRFGEEGEPQFTVRLNDDNILGLIGGDMLSSFGDAYMDGHVDFDGDLADLMSLALRNGLMKVNQETNGFADAAMRVADKLRSFTHEKANIAHHYDLGNDTHRHRPA